MNDYEGSVRALSDLVQLPRPYVESQGPFVQYTHIYIYVYIYIYISLSLSPLQPTENLSYPQSETTY